MQKRVVGLALIVSLVLLSSVFIVSAFSFSDFFNNLFHGKITGKATSVSNLPSGLIGYWAGDGNAIDGSGSSNNGAWSGTENYTSGKSGQAMSFNAPTYVGTSYIGLNKRLDYSSGQISFVFWVKLRAFHGRIWDDMGSGNLGQGTSTVWDTVAGGGRFGFRGKTNNGYGNDYIYTPSGILQLNVWQQIGVSYDIPSGAVKIYINGQNVANGTVGAGTISPTLPGLINGAAGYGCQYENCPNEDVDEFMIFNRVLSANEIQQLYSLGSQGTGGSGGGGGGVAIVSSSYNCSSLKSKDPTYFNTCKNAGFDNACYDKNTAAFQGCDKNTRNECTENNMNSASNIRCPVVESIPQISCTDTDNGINYFVKANYTGYTVRNSTDAVSVYGEEMCYYNDSGYKANSCSGSNCMLRESWCGQQNSDILIMQINVSCPNGCSNGACINQTQPQSNCTDSDNGLNEFILGSTTGRAGSFNGETDSNKIITRTDSCAYINGTINKVSQCSSGNCGIVEYSCFGSNLGDYVDYAPLYCPFGCSNGACLRPAGCQNGVPATITEGPSHTLGNSTIVVINGVSYNTSIVFIADNIAKLNINGVQTNSLSNRETYKLSSNVYLDIYSINYNAKETGASSVELIFNYNCPSSSVNCTDSDGGDNIYVKGTTSNNEVSQEDVCLTGGGTSNSLNEFYCDGINVVQSVKTCPNGCANGACINTTSNKTACIPEMQCTIQPTTCPANGTQTKTCTDVNKCGLESSAPDTMTISCTPGVCAGCMINNTCTPYGYRMIYLGQPSYCDIISGQFQVQQSSLDANGNPAKCQNNYECLSNVCSSGECVEVNGFKEFFVKIVCKLSNLFASPESYDECVANNL